MGIKLLLYIILSVSGLMLFKSGGGANTFSLYLDKISMSFSMISLVGIFCYGCSFLLWLNIIKDNKLSYIFPIANGLVTIMTVMGGIIFFQEKIQSTQWIGILCIIIGITLINMYK